MGLPGLSDLGPPELLAHPVMLNWHKVTLGINVLTSEIVSATTNSLSNVAPEKLIDQAVLLRNQRGRRGPGAHVHEARRLVPMCSLWKASVICSWDRLGFPLLRHYGAWRCPAFLLFRPDVRTDALGLGWGLKALHCQSTEICEGSAGKVWAHDLRLTVGVSTLVGRCGRNP